MMQRNFHVIFILTLIIVTNASRNGKIITADEKNSPSFPFMVELIDDQGKHVCSGCVLADEDVLTSARCIKVYSQVKNQTNLKVRAGDVVFTNYKLPTTQVREVRNFIVHPEYNEETFENDIALLKISEPFMPSINLHEAIKGKSKPFGRCFFPGWNITIGENASTKLNYLTIYVTSDDKCSLTIKNTLCAETHGEASPCEEDYGGPLICGEKVHGVFIGPSESCQGKPAMFTDITRYEDWIDSNTVPNLEGASVRGYSLRNSAEITKIQFRQLYFCIIVIYLFRWNIYKFK